VPSWARPGPGPAVTENGCYVVYAPSLAPRPRCSNSIYHRADRTWAADLLARVEASGYESVVLTVDVQVYSRRERDIVHRFTPREAMKQAAQSPAAPTQPLRVPQ
jgi:isopentenyl diphosphate isomerase/L-lactate dehydrogenase-like FMN-dependent dehydrogenase